MNLVILKGTMCYKKNVMSAKGLICNFSVHIKEKIKSNSGWFEDENYIRCVAYGNVADIIDKYMQDGSNILLEGRLKTSKFKGQDGTEKRLIQVVVERIEFIDWNKRIAKVVNEDKSAIQADDEGEF